MAIGNWGAEIIFTVSDRKVLTFNDLNHSVGSAWATHSRIGLKDQVEYLRPNLQKLSFAITLDANLGVRPRATLELLERHAELGSVFPVVVGGRRIGRHSWRMTEVSESWENILNRGELVQAKVNVTMEEYV